jgi:hypothetical protein
MLDPEDQDLIINLVFLSPQFLSVLIEQGVPIGRPWISWIALANNSHDLVKEILKVKKDL